MRRAVAAVSGAIFGLGLMISGMTDTTKVQGWLDFLGDWDPTLAFVLGGAILPMAVAWALAGRLGAPAFDTRFPAPPDPQLDRQLAIGSILFGMGWGLAGLCPGPSLASLSWGGWGGALFLIAMVAGMLAAPPVARRLLAV
ncbi:hypothetical protein HKCCE3408_07035 [Rhodobacterales bacterium HKCCE3408]|nr:hypothetical protein [Rhodobacterales bacterium HKCCE3408]